MVDSVSTEAASKVNRRLTPLAHAVRFARMAGITKVVDLASELQCTPSAVYRAIKQLEAADCAVTICDQSVKSDHTELTERSLSDHMVTFNDRAVTRKSRSRARIESPSGILTPSVVSEDHHLETTVENPTTVAAAAANRDFEISSQSTSASAPLPAIQHDADGELAKQAHRIGIAETTLANQVAIYGRPTVTAAVARLCGRIDSGEAIRSAGGLLPRICEDIRANPPKQRQKPFVPAGAIDLGGGKFLSRYAGIIDTNV